MAIRLEVFLIKVSVKTLKTTISNNVAQCAVHVATLKTLNIEVDHKDGRKDDSRVSDSNAQTFDDFQALCKACND